MFKLKINDKKNISILTTLVMSISLLLVSTYSWFASFYAVQNIEGLFYYELNVAVYESTTNVSILESALPMGVNEAIEEVYPHEFIIETTSETPIAYYIIVLDNTPISVESIDADNIYYAVNVNGSPYYSVGTLTPNAAGRELVYQGSMPGNATDTISIRLWLGPGATVDGAASYSDPSTLERTYRYFEAKILVEVE